MLHDDVSLIMPLKRKVLFRRYRLTNNTNADLCSQVVNKMDTKTLSMALTNTFVNIALFPIIPFSHPEVFNRYLEEYFTTLGFPII